MQTLIEEKAAIVGQFLFSPLENRKPKIKKNEEREFSLNKQQQAAAARVSLSAGCEFGARR